MMTQPRKAQLLTIGLLALALGIAVGRKQVFRSSGESPPAAAQDAIYAMLDASGAADACHGESSTSRTAQSPSAASRAPWRA